MNYYNENDEACASWICELIEACAIAPGVVDTRDIRDVLPSDLEGFTQCHFFAGIGVWSLALRSAGWPDDRPVWTGSCPCQPFSTAGEGLGFTDERHLWPAFYWLISQRRPAIVIGEQVAAKAADPWVDLVSTDMEALGSAFGSVAFPAAGVGAPHIRDRNYWVAIAASARLQGSAGRGQRAHAQRAAAERSGPLVGVADAAGQRLGIGGRRGVVRAGRSRGEHGDSVEARGLDDTYLAPAGNAISAGRKLHGVSGDAGGMADDNDRGLARFAGLRIRGSDTNDADGRGPVRGFWSGADWIPCRDDKWRPVEPGTFPLAHGAPARVGRLRGYGNAICAPAAQAFIESVMETL